MSRSKLEYYWKPARSPLDPPRRANGEVPLFLPATLLTAFNDNAAITDLATLVPGFTEPLKHAIVAGPSRAEGSR